MKKYSLILWAALTVTGAFTACTDNDSPVTEQTKAKTVTIRATIDGGLGSRVALTDDEENQVVKVNWAYNDKFKISVNGTSYTFTYNTSTREFECSNFPETFPATETLTATYPATTISSSAYTSQPGTLDGAAALLSMEATLDVNEGQSTSDLNLNFTHNNSIVKLTLKNDAFKSKSVTEVALKTGRTAVTTATGTFTGATDGSIVAYLAVKPKTMEDIAVLAACEDNIYFVELSDNELQSGKLYDVNKTVESVIRTAEQAVKGDFALADGSFISRYATLTDEQKSKVRGIVFWTTAETTKEGRTTPASLTDDAVMANDYPDCTHGLIVALENIIIDSYNLTMHWQSTTSDVTNFTPSSNNYVSIGVSQTDASLNKILGYQNTKFLQEYHSDRSNSWGYYVKPVRYLATFAEENPAPEGTTGWYIPSPKELHMLIYKDVDDIYNNYGESGYTDTRYVINASFSAAGVEQLSQYGMYWTSAQNTDTYAWVVYSSTAQVESSLKRNIYLVRAVCAY